MLAGPLGTRYVGDIDRMFDAYSQCAEYVTDHVRSTIERGPDDSEFVYRTATRAKALDAVRGMLPAAATSNVGIYGTGQAFEALLLRMRSHRCPRPGEYADLMLHELRKVIPSFLRRVDLPERGGKWSDYLADTRELLGALVGDLLGDTPVEPSPEVTLVDFDADAEDNILAAICYSHSSLPEYQILAKVRGFGVDERVSLLKAYIGDRTNRRHKPGRAFERSFYRFDVLSDYGAFRDMQRHRMLTIEWQKLTPNHGYTRPELVDEAGVGAAVRRDDAALGRPPRFAARRLLRTGALCRVDGVSDAVQHAVQRARGVPHVGAAFVAPGASRRTDVWRSTCTA